MIQIRFDANSTAYQRSLRSQRPNTRVVFVGEGEAGELPPSLDLTFPPTGLSENLGEWKGGGEGKGKGKGGEDHLPYSPTGFCLKYHLPNTSKVIKVTPIDMNYN